MLSLINIRALTRFFIVLALLSFIWNPMFAEAANQSSFTWQTANYGDDSVKKIVESVVKLIMYMCLAGGMILIVIAVKGLMGTGQWPQFWTKIAGAVILIVIPTVWNWLQTQG